MTGLICTSTPAGLGANLSGPHPFLPCNNTRQFPQTPTAGISGIPNLNITQEVNRSSPWPAITQSEWHVLSSNLGQTDVTGRNVNSIEIPLANKELVSNASQLRRTLGNPTFLAIRRLGGFPLVR